MKLTICSVLMFLAIPVYAQGPDPKDAEAVTTPSSSTSIRQTGYAFPDARERRSRYIKRVFGPMALGRTVLNAGFSTVSNSPEEWGGQWEGFGKRVASNMGKRVIKHSVMYGFDEALKLDSKFYRSHNKDVSARIGNALISPLTARTPNGKRTFGLPRVVGTYTSHVVAAETWYPSRYTYKDGLRSGTISLGMNAVFNVVREFVRKR